MYQTKVNKRYLFKESANGRKKETDYGNKAITKSNENIDHIFVSSWLKEVYKGME